MGRGLLLGAVLLIAACGGEDETSAPSRTSSPPTTVATTPTTSTTNPPTTTDATGMERVGDVTLGATRPAQDVPQDLPDGSWFGLVHDIDLDRHIVVFDLVEWFVGEDANRAAVEDGDIEAGDVVPNDYYMRNQSSATRDVPYGDHVEVTVAWCPSSCGQYRGDLAGLAASFGTGETAYSLADPYHGERSQYWLTVEAGLLVAIDEQYLP